MLAVLTIILVLATSLMVVRIATVALMLTGLSKQLARFQARSAFTGAGFTTSESEMVVSHPLRRRIIMMLMLLGNAGVVTGIASVVLSFVTIDERGQHLGLPWERLLLLAAGVAGLWAISFSSWVDRHMTGVIAWALRRWTDLEVRDYADLLHLAGEYGVVEKYIAHGSWLANRPLKDSKLADEGMLVLGVVRSTGQYLGAPRGHTQLQAGDTAIVYGRRGKLAELDRRRLDFAGQMAHAVSVAEQRRVEQQEKQEDRQTGATQVNDLVDDASNRATLNES